MQEKMQSLGHSDINPQLTLEQAIRAVNEPVDHMEVKLAEEQIIKQVGKRKYHTAMNGFITDDMRRKQRRLLSMAKKKDMLCLD